MCEERVSSAIRAASISSILSQRAATRGPHGSSMKRGAVARSRETSVGASISSARTLSFRECATSKRTESSSTASLTVSASAMGSDARRFLGANRHAIRPCVRHCTITRSACAWQTFWSCARGANVLNSDDFGSRVPRNRVHIHGITHGTSQYIGSVRSSTRKPPSRVHVCASEGDALSSMPISSRTFGTSSRARPGRARIMSHLACTSSATIATRFVSSDSMRTSTSSHARAITSVRVFGFAHRGTSVAAHSIGGYGESASVRARDAPSACGEGAV